jgi:hypothetical protein
MPYNPLRKPCIGTEARDRFDAQERRRLARRCACGNRLFLDDSQCTPCRRPMPTVTLDARSQREARDYTKSTDRKH